MLALLSVSLGIPFEPIGRWLEGRHPAILVPEEAPELVGIRWIVVLGEGLPFGEQLPVSSLPDDVGEAANLFWVRFSGVGGRPSALEILDFLDRSVGQRRRLTTQSLAQFG